MTLLKNFDTKGALVTIGLFIIAALVVNYVVMPAIEKRKNKAGASAAPAAPAPTV